MYTCVANRCNLGKWIEQPTVNLTVYVLPEGFDSVGGIINPDILKSYQAEAERSYVITNLPTNPETVNGRSYQTVTLQANGTYTTETNVYIKPDVKEQRVDVKPTTSTAQSLTTGQVMAAAIAGLGAIVAIIGGWRYYRARQLPS